MKPTTRRKTTTERKGKAPDKILLTSFIAMIIFGAIMIFDASVYMADQPPFNDPFHFLKLHLFWLAIGSIAATFIVFWDYRKFIKLVVPGMIVCILMLVAVLFAEDTNGSRRWLRFGSDQLVIQPAEFIKPVFILYISTWLAKQNHNYKTFQEAFKRGFGSKLIGFGATLGTVLVLVLLEPDLGTTLIIGITAFSVFLAAGTDVAHLIGTGLIGVMFSGVAVLAAIIAPYRLTRVRTFINLLLTGQVDDPHGAGYQIQQILIGIGSAGFWGKGFGQSRQRFGYLVELTAFTDSIFAVVLEELGMLGGIIFIAGWMLILSRGLRVAKYAPDREGKLIAIGVTVWLVSQALLNMAANVGLIPLTGIPLPFFTYGGSGTIVAMIGMGILLNISRFTDEPKISTK